MLKKYNQQELDSFLGKFLLDVGKSFTVDDAILYGSYVKGTATENSDIDLMIVSSDLPKRSSKGMNGYRIISKLDDSYPGLELIGVHPETLQNNDDNWFFREIQATGKSII